MPADFASHKSAGTKLAVVTIYTSIIAQFLGLSPTNILTVVLFYYKGDLMKTYLIIAVALLAFHFPAQSQEIDLTEGKIQAAEANMRQDLMREVEKKEVQAIQLINLLARFNNDRFSSDIEKGESEDAYYAFLARFNSLKEDKMALEKKEISSSIRDLKNYSGRFDQLIKDLQKFLK